MDKKFIDLYDEYTHAPLDRRDFISRLTALAGSTAAASALLPLLENNYALAQVVPPTDARLETSRITWAGASGELKGYLAKPKGAGKLPASSSSTKIADRTRISKTSSAGLRWKASWRWDPIYSARSAAHQRTRIRRVH